MAALGMFGVLGPLTYPLPAAWLGLGALVGLALARWRLVGRPLPCTPFAIPFGLYLAGGVVGLLVSFRPPMAEIRFFGLIAAVAALLLLLELAGSQRGARYVVLGGLLLTAATMPVLAIVVGPHLRIDRLPGLGPELVAGLLAPFDPVRRPVLEADAVMQRYRLRSSGVGMLATYGIGLALGPLLAGPTRMVRLLAGAAVAYFVLFVLLSGHRFSIIAAGLLLVLFGGLRYRRVAAALVVGSVAFGATAWIALRSSDAAANPLLGLLPRAATDLGPLAVRQELWRGAVFMLGDFPLTGVGMGIRSPRAVLEDYFAMIDTSLEHGHNIYVQSYLEQGLLGLVGLVGLSMVAAVVGWRALRRVREPWLRAMAISGSAAATALLLSGLTEIGPTTSVGGVLLFCALGLMGAAYRTVGGSTAPPAARTAAARPESTRGGTTTVRARWRPWTALALVLAIVLSTLLLAPSAGPPLRHAVGAVFLNLASVALYRTAVGEDNGERTKWHLLAAERYLDQARSLRPDDPRVYRKLAAVELSRERPKQARVWLERAETLTASDDEPSWFQLARLRRESGDVDEALAAWSRVGRTYNAWSCSSKDMQLLRWSAKLARSRRWSAAEETARASIEAMPAYPLGYRLISTALSRHDSPPAAIAAMSEFAEARPDVLWPYLELADLHAGLGQLTEAATWAQLAAEVDRPGRWPAERERHLIRDCQEYLDEVTYVFRAQPDASATSR